MLFINKPAWPGCRLHGLGKLVGVGGTRVAVGVREGGILVGVAVGGTGVAVGTGVDVGGMGVAVGTGVEVGGTGVAVGTGVKVGGIGVAVAGTGVTVGATAHAVESERTSAKRMRGIKLFIGNFLSSTMHDGVQSNISDELLSLDMMDSTCIDEFSE